MSNPIVRRTATILMQPRTDQAGNEQANRTVADWVTEACLEVTVGAGTEATDAPEDVIVLEEEQFETHLHEICDEELEENAKQLDAELKEQPGQEPTVDIAKELEIARTALRKVVVEVCQKGWRIVGELADAIGAHMTGDGTSEESEGDEHSTSRESD